MRIPRRHTIITITILLALISLQPYVARAQIVCDKFKLLTKLKGSSLALSVDTDLPDKTLVTVSVSRSYLKKGIDAAYSCDYISEKSTIGKWKSKQTVLLDNEKWKDTLRAEQEKLSRRGAGFDVASISDKIDIRMVVPIKQPDPRFGKKNAKLTGKRVSAKWIRVVESEVELDYSMKSPPVGKSSVPSFDPQNLDVDQSYVVSKKTPLMPALSPSDPLEAIKRMKHIPENGAFKIDEIKNKNGTSWYRVTAIDQRNKRIGTGWVNSTALFGQELKQYK